MMQTSDNANISLTDAASVHVRRQLAQTQCGYLRLGLKESGCNGFMYMLDFLESPADDDICFEFDEGVRICVRRGDLEMVSGTEVDMITEGLNSALVFKNPNATSYCGCGESFAVNGDPASRGIDPGDLATDVGAP